MNVTSWAWTILAILLVGDLAVQIYHRKKPDCSTVPPVEPEGPVNPAYNRAVATVQPPVEPESQSVFGKNFFAIGSAGEDNWTIYRFREGILPNSLALEANAVWENLDRALAERMIEEFEEYVDRCEKVEP